MFALRAQRTLSLRTPRTCSFSSRRRLLPQSLLRAANVPDPDVLTREDHYKYLRETDTYNPTDPTWQSTTLTPDQMRFEIRRLSKRRELSPEEDNILASLKAELESLEEYQKRKAEAEANKPLPSTLMVYHGAGSLLERSAPVPPERITKPEFQHRLGIMKLEFEGQKAMGLAAPQIGWQSRIICFGHRMDEETLNAHSPEVQELLRAVPFQVWINPMILQVSKKKCWYWEGCLSAPGVRAWIERPSKIIVGGFDEHGEEKTATLTHLAARVFQHEHDHLDGVLFTTRCSKALYVVPLEAFEGQRRDEWPVDWPSYGARRTLPDVQFSDVE